MHIKVNQTELFYEQTGDGPPVILLHGNGEDHTIFDVVIKRLSKDYTVYAIDSRGHGKSGRVAQLNYHDMMEDVAAFIGELRIDKPILYGFSDGGIIGLLLAIKYPDMLSKLIISGANINPKGMKAVFRFLMKVNYFFTRSKKIKLMLTQPDIKEAELNKIVTPTFIVAGSNDLITEEHTRLIARNIPDSVLRILEREGHDSYVVHSEKLYGIIYPFLIETVD